MREWHRGGSVSSLIAELREDVDALDTLMGDTSISGIGNGTVTGAISTINNNLSDINKSVTNGNLLPDHDYLLILKDNSINSQFLFAMYRPQAVGQSYVNFGTVLSNGNNLFPCACQLYDSNGTVYINNAYRYYGINGNGDIVQTAWNVDIRGIFQLD